MADSYNCNGQLLVVNNCIIRGNGNKIVGKANNINGNDNEIAGNGASVRGNNNKIRGNGISVYGNENHCTGNGCSVKGNDNNIIGNGCHVTGDRNRINGKLHSSTFPVDATVHSGGIVVNGGIGIVAAPGAILFANNYIATVAFQPPLQKSPKTIPPPSGATLPPLDPSADTQTEDEGASCQICMNNARCILFKPCGHVACCLSCSHALKKKAEDERALHLLCPVCKQGVRAGKRVFL